MPAGGDWTGCGKSEPSFSSDSTCFSYVPPEKANDVATLLAAAGIQWSEAAAASFRGRISRDLDGVQKNIQC